MRVSILIPRLLTSIFIHKYLLVTYNVPGSVPAPEEMTGSNMTPASRELQTQGKAVISIKILVN